MKKIFFYLSFFSLLLTACKSSDGPEEPSTPVVNTDKLSITAKPIDAFSSDGGEGTIELTASADWSASSSCDWFTISPSSGNAGTGKVTVKVNKNNSYDERNAQITLKCGNIQENVTITQKQLDALTITSNKIETSADGGEATIEVKANVQYEYAIEESAQQWISVPATRGLSTSTINLSIAKNEDIENREGKVTITSGNLSETVTVYQAGAKASIVLTQKEYNVASAGEQIKVELQSNCDYNIEMPAVEWISKAETRAMSSYTHYFSVAENTTYDAREAEIIFTNKENGITETVKIKQSQKNAIVVAKNLYELESDACTLDFEVQSNIDFEVSSSVDWISKVATRALSGRWLYFNVSANEGEDREGTITLTAGNLKQEITVKQAAKSLIKFVDLGLPSGTLWADMNLGATAIEEPGDHYAWGEVETKTAYTWETYKFGTQGNLTNTIQILTI